MCRDAIERSWWQPRPTALTRWLRPLAWLYGRAWAWRALADRRGWQRRWHAPVPVVVVGNLIAGGAGKTPTVIALVQALRTLGWTPGVISRGYGARRSDARAVRSTTPAADCGDEPKLIHVRTGVPTWVGHDRRAVAAALCRAHPEVDLLVSDDGLQHLALHRDAQIVVFDERGVGNGRLLPAGPLREPVSATPPPDTLVLYNADRPTMPWPGPSASRALGGIVPLREWWRGVRPEASMLSGWHGRQVVAAAGIAAPERFFSMLEAAGLRLDRLPLADHAALEPRPWPADADVVVVTEKDAVKLPADAPDLGNVHVATLDFQIPAVTLSTLQAWLAPLKRHP